MMRRSEKRTRRPREERPDPGPWLLLFAVAVGLRVAVALLSLGPRAGADAGPLDAVAWNLARGAGFSLEGPRGPVATAAVPPLSPWLTSLVYRAAGHEATPSTGALRAALLVQCAVGGLAALLIAWFGAATFGGTIGRLAGWLTACDPLLLGASDAVRAELLLGVLVLVALGATAAWIKTPRPGRALGVGVAWGLGVLAHDGILMLPLLALAWAWVPLGLTVTPGDRNRQAFLMLLGVALAVGPWVLRNAIVMRAPVAVTTSAGRAFLAGNRDAALRGADREDDGAIADPAPARGRDEPRADRSAAAAGWSVVAGRIGQWPLMAARKLSRLWAITSERDGPSPTDGPPVRAALAGLDLLAPWSLVTFPLALWGIARTLTSARRWYQSLGLLVVLYFSGLAVVFRGSLPLRIPIEPLLALYAAVGFEGARRRLRSRRLGLKVVEGRR